MLRCISVVASCVIMLAFGALSASAGTSRVHPFGIPGVYGVRAWGSYSNVGAKVRVTVCVKDTVRSVYGAAAVGLAFNSSYRRHDGTGAAAIGYGHSQCHAMLSPYTSHLVVEALSGDKNGKIRERGKLKQIY